MQTYNMTNDFPRTCLPSDIDTSNLIDVTTIGCEFKVFKDVNDGTIHDCKKYYELAIDQIDIM